MLKKKKRIYICLILVPYDWCDYEEDVMAILRRHSNRMVRIANEAGIRLVVELNEGRIATKVINELNGALPDSLVKSIKEVLESEFRGNIEEI